MDTGNYTMAQYAANEAGWLAYGAAMACFRFIAQHAVGPNVLDIGGGTGVGAAMLKVFRPSYRVLIVEQTRAPLERAAERGVDGITWDEAGRIAAGDATYNTVYSSHVLEHLSGPTLDRVVAESFRVARQRVIHVVPAGDVEDRNSGTPHQRVFEFGDLACLTRPHGWRFRVEHVIRDDRMDSLIAVWSRGV